MNLTKELLEAQIDQLQRSRQKLLNDSFATEGAIQFAEFLLGKLAELEAPAEPKMGPVLVKEPPADAS